jgi:hypothetical protein
VSGKTSILRCFSGKRLVFRVRQPIAHVAAVIPILLSGDVSTRVSIFRLNLLNPVHSVEPESARSSRLSIPAGRDRLVSRLDKLVVKRLEPRDKETLLVTGLSVFAFRVDESTGTTGAPGRFLVPTALAVTSSATGPCSDGIARSRAWDGWSDSLSMKKRSTGSSHLFFHERRG